MEEASWGFPIHGIGRRRLVEMGFLGILCKGIDWLSVKVMDIIILLA
jgi:hypothetical protein